MKGNILGILFTILSGVLIALIVLAYGRSDRIAPEFRFSALNLTYDSSTEDKDLLVGINAYDSVDGDLTDRIVVEKVVLNREAGTAVVYYAVADYSGNVTKQSRVFPADIKDMENNGDTVEVMEDSLFSNMGLNVESEADQESSEGVSTEGISTESGN
ncbi:hypothetical protein SAMN04487928_10854 [Butyrivibrio proteoclasticus]|uniref:Uncharacterized protein n=1 Tax=Butyrivibrio proteoclasticus TaxID=43305 RepID=A0A1I5T7S4_9FIRM|nr:hypothetical protein [Butyrivibrio proteoclasticus]SFP79018.1 hypothetical protein SAMN04487928_10854 [Butyrivibrio proteoclasticus]